MRTSWTHISPPSSPPTPHSNQHKPPIHVASLSRHHPTHQPSQHRIQQPNPQSNMPTYLQQNHQCSRSHQLHLQLPLTGPNLTPLQLQVLGELSRVLTAKLKKSSEDAREMLLSWADAMVVADTTWSAFQAAMDLSVDHQISMWDALILSVAAENKCRLLLSEDFQNGFTWRGVTVVNPFETKAKPYKLLAMAI